jgi:hypothetical protein
MPARPTALLALALTLLPFGLAVAQETPMCRNGLFSASPEPIGRARVVAPDRTHFRDDSGACPTETPACQTAAYLITGDVVLTAQSWGAFVCAYFPNTRGGTAGYLPRAALTLLPAPPPPGPKDWNGVWGAGDHRLRIIALHDGRLTVAGEAYWPAAKVDPKVYKGGVRMGMAGGEGRPQGDRVEIVGPDPEGCGLTLRLVGRHLLADDNARCGPPNVRFRSVFTPVTAAPPPFLPARSVMERALDAILRQADTDEAGVMALLGREAARTNDLQSHLTPTLVATLRRREKALVATDCGGRYVDGMLCGFDYVPLTCGNGGLGHPLYRTDAADADAARITVAEAERPRSILAHYRLVRHGEAWLLDGIACAGSDRFNWR